ncbi:hypothetical protein NIES4071_56810 [Calothrix sp. NIES-4071]|nr:hypothetical protein NIES4071_56810 [Calothrix sp. NIES-4071]BAZ59988.1 hypothetical protein NIES4105_56760 [Calothrix sp. NIES-4105]
MGLTKEQRELFHNALMDAFPTKQSLEMMLSFKLDWSLNQITTGANHEEIVFKLIQNAEAKGNVTELLEAAIKENPGNPKLNEFNSTYLNSVTQQYDIKNLKLLLNEIEFTLLKNSYLQTLPSNTVTDNIELSEIKSIDNIINNLSRYEKRNDKNTPYLVQWIIKIAKSLTKSHNCYQQIINYLNPILTSLNIQDIRFEESESQECDSHLALIIIPELEKFCLEPMCIKGDNIEPLNYVAKNENKLRTGTLCSEKSIPQEVNEIIAYFLKNKNAGLSLIEIYLPYQLLYTDVSDWCYTNDNKQSVPIIEDFHVVVHATDRITGLYNFKYLVGGWNNLMNILSSKEPSLNIQENIKTVNRTDNLKWQQLGKELKNKIGIKLTKPLLNFETEQQEFIKAIFNGGVPFAFWLKCKPSRNRKLELIDCYLTSECLNNNLEKLIKHVYEMRTKAYREKNPKQHLGYHLGFVCDIPDKIAKVRKLKTTKAQLIT